MTIYYGAHSFKKNIVILCELFHFFPKKDIIIKSKFQNNLGKSGKFHKNLRRAS